MFEPTNKYFFHVNICEPYGHLWLSGYFCTGPPSLRHGSLDRRSASHRLPEAKTHRSSNERVCPGEADAVLRRVLAATGLGPTGWIGESYGIHASVMLNLSWEQMEVCIKVACRQVNQLECHRC